MAIIGCVWPTTEDWQSTLNLSNSSKTPTRCGVGDCSECSEGVWPTVPVNADWVVVLEVMFNAMTLGETNVVMLFSVVILL